MQCSIGGGRDVKCMYYETSLLDAQEGIRFRGYSIPELQEKLPTFKGPAGQGKQSRTSQHMQKLFKIDHSFSRRTTTWGIDMAIANLWDT